MKTRQTQVAIDEGQQAFERFLILDRDKKFTTEFRNLLGRCCMNAGNSLIPLILRFCPKNVTC